MDFEMIFFYISLVTVIPIFLLYTVRLHVKKKTLTKIRAAPPCPPALPIVGHLHLFKDPEHRCLQSLADQYGPVFHLRLGRCSILVVSSTQAAEECLTQNDIVFADRPKFVRGELLAYNYTTSAWAPYGELWRSLRRVTTIEALTASRLNESALVRETEIRFVTREKLLGRNRSCGEEVELNLVFVEMVKNVVMRMACGKRWEVDSGKALIAPQMMNVYDFFPALRWFPYKGLEKQMNSISRKWDGILGGIIEEARNDENMDKSVLVHRLLDLQKAEPGFYTDDIIKGLVLVVLTGGTDNIARTMEWAMSLLINHPMTLKKAQAEIDGHVGTTRLVADSDLPNLSYLRNIVNETFRLYPVSPFLAPHSATSDTTVSGYHVPKGTTLIINAWALHRDPSVWDDPTTFKPERFEEEKTTMFKLMPFGFGRRGCPGVNLSMKLVMLAVATCIQCFDWETVDGKAVDMEELGGGLTLRKRLPLTAICTPRPCMAHILSQLSDTCFDFSF